MNTLHVPMGLIKANPFRDIDNYDFDEKVLVGLANSYDKTDFWENFGLRPTPGTVPEQFDSVEDYITTLHAMDEDDQVAFLFENECSFQQDSGHHRSEAYRRWLRVKYAKADPEEGDEAVSDRIDQTTIEVHVRDWDDDLMLVVMALENQEAFRARPLVALETTEVVVNRMESHLKECASWDEYSAKGYSTFKSRKAFANAGTQGIGIRTVRAYLGEDWSEKNIRFSLAALRDIKSDFYTREDLKGFTSVTIIGAFSSLVQTLVKEGVPVELVKIIAKECAEVITVKEVSHNTVIAATNQFKTNGNDPTIYLKKEVLSKMNWHKFLKGLDLGDYDATELVAGGSETWIKMAEAVQEEIEKDVEKEVKDEKLNREVTAKAEADDISEDDARALILKERAGDDSEPGIVPDSDEDKTGGMPDMDGLGLDDGSTPTTAPETTPAGLSILLGSSLTNLTPQITSLRGQIEDIDKETDQGKIFFDSLSISWVALTELMMEDVGVKEIRTLISKISKANA